MWSVLNRMEACEGHLRSHGLYLLDYVRRNGAIVGGLVAESCIHMHIEREHLLQHIILASQSKLYIVRTQCRIIGNRILWHACQERGTRQGQEWVVLLCSRIVIEVSYGRNAIKILVAYWFETKIVLHGGLDTKLLRTKRGDVEVHFQNLQLGILLRQANHHGCFGNFSLQRHLFIIREVFDQLLGDGTTATLYRARRGVLTGGAEDALGIYARIIPEGLVLRGNHGILHYPWYVIERNRNASPLSIVICHVEELAITVIDTGGLVDLPDCQSLKATLLALVITIGRDSTGRNGHQQEKQESGECYCPDFFTIRPGSLPSLAAMVHEHCETYRARAFPGL